MRLSTVAFLAVVGTAMAESAITAPVANLAKTNNKRSLSRLFRRDDFIPCSTDSQCQKQHSGGPYTPGTCIGPLTNDPEQKAYDTRLRDGYGFCGADGFCDCGVEQLSQPDLWKFCIELVGAVASSYILHGACMDFVDDIVWCDIEDPSGTFQPGSDGDINLTTGDAWKCVDGKYVGKTGQ